MRRQLKRFGAWFYEWGIAVCITVGAVIAYVYAYVH